MFQLPQTLIFHPIAFAHQMPSAFSVINDLLEMIYFSVLAKYTTSKLRNPQLDLLLDFLLIANIRYCGIRTTLSQFTFSLKVCSKTLFLHIILDGWKVLSCQYNDVCQYYLLFICMCQITEKSAVLISYTLLNISLFYVHGQVVVLSGRGQVSSGQGCLKIKCCKKHIYTLNKYVFFLCPWRAMCSHLHGH